MNITFNNQNQNGIYIFDGQPNIITFEDGTYTGTPSRLTITCPDGLTAGEEGVIIEVNGEQITSVPVQSDAGPREFAISDIGMTTANNICRALRNVSSLLVNFSVYFGADRYGQGMVTVLARQLTTEVSGSCTNEYITVVSVPSGVQSSARVASVNVSKDSTYVATLEKTICSDRTNFDVSPIISSLTEYGRLAPVTFTTWTSDSDGNVSTGRTYNMTAIKGYHTEGQPLYLSGATMLQNVQGTLYIGAGQPLVFSWLNTASGDLDFVVNMLGSDYSTIGSTGATIERADNEIVDVTIDMSSMSDEVWYLDLLLPDGKSVKYNVIRPSRLSEGNVRMQWRNGMGGISFFDFTGARTEKNNLEYDTYRDEGSSYGYYDAGMRYDRIKRNASNDIEYTLQTHLVKEDSLGIFRDLARSERVWIGENMVLVSSIEYNEQSNGVYIVRVTYKKSRIN